MNKDIFIIEQEELTKSDKILNCVSPFDFIIEINDEKRYDLIQKVNLKNIRSLDFSNAGINNLDFLTNDTLANLRTLYLNNNSIEDIRIFDNDKIHFHELDLLFLENNPIKKGFEALKKNFFQKCLSVKLDLSLTELKVFIQFNSPNYNLNIFVNNLNEIANIFQKDKVVFGYISSEVADKFKEIFCLTSEEYEKKSQTYKPKEVIKPDYDDDIKQNIIIDNGTSYCKAGLSGEEGPRAVFPSYVGYPKYSSGMKRGDEKEFFVGADAESKRGVLKINYPIEKGVINNWMDMEKIWENIFTNELRVAPEEYNVMLTEPPNNPKENREKMAQIMFETFNVPRLYFANQAVLALYSYGKYSGIVIDSGEDLSYFVPIFDGFYLSHAVIQLDLAGRDLTKFMMKLLNEAGYRFSTSYDKEAAKSIKEKACYVAPDFEEEFKCSEPFDYELLDGTHVIVKDQRFRCPEALFKPSMIGKDEIGFSQTCYDSIQKCDIDIKRYMYNSIILSGGNTMFNGFSERLTKEIRMLAPESMKEEIRVCESYDRRFAVWAGGSILSSISTFESSWITKNEYEENGATIVHRKCF